MITFNKFAQGVSGSLGITTDRKDELDELFIQQVKEWEQSEEDTTTGHLLGRMFKIAKTDAEQCFCCFLFGRFLEINYGYQI